MPDWTPPPDVVFDHLRARQLIDDASRIAATLRTLAMAERAAFGRARRYWVGRVRAEIDRGADQHESSLELAIHRLEQLVTAMDRAVDDAIREQTRRQALQADWEAQCRAEVAAIADLAEPFSGGVR